ncbi:aldo/keto reductase [Qipengyuania sp. MTN3-11]|uniref:aldo/keto reductase n=1 Tax=Qipengyuania sp. MTN3-11 TaxID=3056557 RepID=UPI0036F2AB34
MTIPKRQLGPFTVSAVGLGCMNLSHAYDVVPSVQDAAQLLDRSLDLGVTLLDTAALYGMGDNERLLGKAVGHRRNDFTLASKCVLFGKDGKRVLDGSPAAIADTLEASLERLQTDHIDLYYLHRLDRNVPIEDSVGALVRAKEAGKIGAIGLSEMSAETIRRAHAVHTIAAVQSEYSPMVRNPEIAVLDACRELGIGFVAFSPLARGMLAGSVRGDDYVEGDIRANMPRFSGDALAHNLSLADRFFALAGEAGCTPGQLALAWLLAKGDHIVAIPGTRRVERVEENLGAAKIALSPDTVEQIDELFVPGAVHGPRYLAGAQAQIDTETFPDEELAAG